MRGLARRGMTISRAPTRPTSYPTLKRGIRYSTSAGFYSIRSIVVCQYQTLFDLRVMIHEIERGAAAEVFLFGSPGPRLPFAYHLSRSCADDCPIYICLGQKESQFQIRSAYTAPVILF